MADNQLLIKPSKAQQTEQEKNKPSSQASKGKSFNLNIALLAKYSATKKKLR
ncbi:MAG: hypothetical protein QMC62_10600 [Alteromonadaceae bacterium]